MDTNVIYAFLLTLLAGLTTGVGSVIGLFVPRSNKKFLSLVLGFSAGVMIYVSFMEMIPKSQGYLDAAYGTQNGVWWMCGALFFGMAVIMLIDNFIPSPESDLTAQKTGQHSSGLERMGVMTALAIAIHFSMVSTVCFSFGSKNTWEPPMEAALSETTTVSSSFILSSSSASKINNIVMIFVTLAGGTATCASFS